MGVLGKRSRGAGVSPLADNNDEETTVKQRNQRARRGTQGRAGFASALVLVVSTPVAAFEFETDGGWRGSFNNTVSLGASWRAQSPDPKLYSAGDGAAAGYSKPGKGGSNTDSGDLNWDKGDRTSTLFKLVSELSLTKGDMGGFIRAKAWYDQALKDEDVRLGSGANGFQPGQRLSDASQPALNKYDGVALLDAYVFNTFDLGEMPLQVRVGRQVVNWGESLFIQGLNQLNPVDAPALRKPGTEIKEALLPVWSLYGNLGLGGGMSLEAFYQLKWEESIVDSCGGYWSAAEWQITTSAGSGCKAVATTVNAALGNAASLAAGQYVPLSDGKDGKDSGQWGLALRIPVEAIDAEVGLYGMRINSRTPIISTRVGTWGASGIAPILNPLAAQQVALGAAGVRAATGFWEYPDGINLYGVSLSTNLAGWSLGAELSHSPNQPIQINGNDLVAGLLRGIGPVGAAHVAATAEGSGTDVHGYERVRKSQIQINAVKVLPAMLGAEQGALAAEVGMQWNDLPDDGRRFGRAFIFGTGSHPTYGGSTCTADGGSNPQPDGCKNDGYVTDFAWGYRVRAGLSYSNAFGSGFTVSPSIFLGHDVKGYSSDGQFLEGRTVIGLGAQADYLKKYAISLGYTKYGDGADYDPFRDRDYYSVSVSTTF
jgi:uncharacterized protein DUF1302